MGDRIIKYFFEIAHQNTEYGQESISDTAAARRSAVLILIKKRRDTPHSKRCAKQERVRTVLPSPTLARTGEAFEVRRMPPQDFG